MNKEKNRNRTILDEKLQSQLPLFVALGEFENSNCPHVFLVVDAYNKTGLNFHG